MVRTGTQQATADHTPALSALGLAVSMGVPVALLVVGLFTYGPGAVSWPGVVVWGLVATAVFTLFMLMGGAMGMSRLDILDLLGSTVAEPGTSRARLTGAAIHHVNGVVLAAAWVYTTLLVGVQATWATGLWWGLILTALALIMLSSVGTVHPAMRRGREGDPGAGALNFGSMTPAGSLMGHLVYGLVLGLGYQFLPLG